MKNYKEIAENVFRRSEEITSETRRKRRKIYASLTVICMIALIGIINLKCNISTHKDIMLESQSENSSIIINSESSLIEENKITNIIIQENSKNTNSDMGNGVMISDNSDFEVSKIKTVISSYSVKDMSDGCYKIPKNGKYTFSVPLQNALEEYSDSVEYRVVVYVFNNEKIVNLNSNEIQIEMDRLFHLGYTPALETYNNGQEKYDNFVLIVSEEQLRKFVVDEKYGYIFFLYDEVMKWIR